MTLGLRGSQIPSVSRAVVACGWNMVQCTLGGAAIGFIVKALVPSFNDQPIGTQVVMFIIFMVACGWVTAKGSKAIRIFESFSSPLLIVLIALLLVWAALLASGSGYSFGDVVVSKLSAADLTQPSQYVFFFLLTLTGNIGFWATMALNIPDFSRYAKTQKVQFRGQMYGMLPAMAFCAIVGAFYAQATFLVYGTASDNPIGVLGYLGDTGPERALIVIVGIGVIFATMTTNIAANIVAPANAFSNLAPKKVGYKLGVIIACVIAGLVYGIPYYVTVAQGGGFIGFMFDFLNYYGAFLAPLAAIFILDYYFIKKRNLDVMALYQKGGRYWYKNGFNVHAIIAWVAGAILPTITGITGFTAMEQGPLAWINANAYLFSFFVALIVYGLIAPRKGVEIITDEQEAAMTETA
jgi:NCS1 family nucleobase:cation symporter-1